VNPVYGILESPHRWIILAGLSFLAACVGAIAMMGYGWSHTVAQIWFYAGFVTAVVCLGRSILQWKRAVEAALAAQEKQGPRSHG